MRTLMEQIKDRNGTYYTQQRVPERLASAHHFSHERDVLKLPVRHPAPWSRENAARHDIGVCLRPQTSRDSGLRPNACYRGSIAGVSAQAPKLDAQAPSR